MSTKLQNPIEQSLTGTYRDLYATSRKFTDSSVRELMKSMLFQTARTPYISSCQPMQPNFDEDSIQRVNVNTTYFIPRTTNCYFTTGSMQNYGTEFILHRHMQAHRPFFNKEQVNLLQTSYIDETLNPRYNSEYSVSNFVFTPTGSISIFQSGTLTTAYDSQITGSTQYIVSGTNYDSYGEMYVEQYRSASPTGINSKYWLQAQSNQYNPIFYYAYNRIGFPTEIGELSIRKWSPFNLSSADLVDQRIIELSCEAPQISERAGGADGINRTTYVPNFNFLNFNDYSETAISGTSYIDETNNTSLSASFYEIGIRNDSTTNFDYNNNLQFLHIVWGAWSTSTPDFRDSVFTPIEVENLGALIRGNI